MTTYYNPSPDGFIIACSDDGCTGFCERDAKGFCTCLTTESEIVRAYDGKLYLAGEAPNKPLELIIKEQQKAFVKAIDNYMDSFARTREYASMASAASYYDDEDPQYAAEGAYCKKMRSVIYRLSDTIRAEVMAGKRSMPTLEEVLAELPVLTWPDTN